VQTLAYMSGRLANIVVVHYYCYFRYLHGCNVLYELVRPWANTDSIVVADSYFASVQAALRLKAIGLRFIGTIKTATREFPMNHLATRVMNEGRGDRYGLLCKDQASGTSLLALCWVDRDRRYFISTCSSLAQGPPCIRKRWRQVDKTPNAAPELVEVVVAQPEVCGIYYTACGKVDQHNRVRQASLMLETKNKTTFWWRRVNMSLFAMMVVDSYELAVGCCPTTEMFSANRRWPTAGNYFAQLAECLIDNTYEQRALRKRQARASASGNEFLVQRLNGVLESTRQLTAPTPTKRQKRKNPKHRAQGKCMVCKALSSHVCRDCQAAQQDPLKQQFWICRKPGMSCMGVHILKEHPNRALVDSDSDEDNAFEI
jgi:Transposase IS4